MKEITCGKCLYYHPIGDWKAGLCHNPVTLPNFMGVDLKPLTVEADRIECIHPKPKDTK